MKISDLFELADEIPGFDELVQSIGQPSATGAVGFDGLAGSARSFVLKRLVERLDRPVLVVTYQHEQALRLWDDIVRFGFPESRAAVLPATNSLFLEGDVTDYRAIGERIRALMLLAQPGASIVIGTAEAVLQRTCLPDQTTPYVFSVEAGAELDLTGTLQRMVQMGYDSATTVTRPGEFSRRGGILDVFSSIAESPVRIELFGDMVESIRPFDVTTQRSTGRADSAILAPAREVRLDDPAAAARLIRAALDERLRELHEAGDREAADRLGGIVEAALESVEEGAYFDGLEQYIPWIVQSPVCAVDHLLAGGALVLDDPAQVEAHWNRLSADMLSARERHWAHGELLSAGLNACPFETLLTQAARRPIVALSLTGRALEGLPIRKRWTVQSAQMESFRSRLPSLADETAAWLGNQCRVVIATDQPHRMREILADLKVPVRPADEKLSRSGGVYVTEGRFRAGFKLSDIRFYLLTDAELFGAARPVVARRKVAGGVAISSVLDLRVNDFVVHIHHGIGLYRGLVKRRSDETERDYLLLEYQGGDRLYVPADQIDRVQRYVGSEGAPPQVNRIGGGEWQRTTKRVREQARDMAAGLIRLYAARQASERPSFGPDTSWQDEMEEAFPYEETPDQLRAIRDVKRDLEGDRPMDRLICGDVGFGKTEVALRAAFKVVSAGKQVAVLCPTTVLAAQHHSTFSDRLAAYPIKVDLLSRFRSRQEQAKTVTGLAQGAVDVVVATHRLLSKDVQFKNLGLVIVDEEQRFGVAHKERLKQLRTSVDVLTLTATPIPRTLSMALSGLRDMSVIEDPPEGRMPVLTYVREYDDELVRDAVLRELERGGQIYFVHNRVESIYHVAQRMQRMVPDIRLEVGHGQMSEEELERVMFDFYHHQSDMLVCTTIIENGLDIPNCNTIIIDNADHMGLAQLYQLRGRVGRSNRQAYSYLLYRRHKRLTEASDMRLAAIREFSALGSGHKVAMRDLEIRGAGNLLGAEQSGAMTTVGFDLYCKLLSQAVQELRGEEVSEDALPAVDLPITAYIPETYIPGEAERIYFYKRMSGVRSIAEVDNLREELEDRFGDPPRPVWDALALLRLRLRCEEIGVASIRHEQANVHIRLSPRVRIPPDAIKLLTYAFKGHRFTPDGVIVPLKGPKALPQVDEILSTLERALRGGKAPAAAHSPASTREAVAPGRGRGTV